MRISSVLTILPLLTAEKSSTTTLNLLTIDETTPTAAQCLDGSPGAYYFCPGPADSTKHVIFLEGGGWCWSEKVSAAST